MSLQPCFQWWQAWQTGIAVVLCLNPSKHWELFLLDKTLQPWCITNKPKSLGNTSTKSIQSKAYCKRYIRLDFSLRPSFLVSVRAADARLSSFVFLLFFILFFLSFSTLSFLVENNIHMHIPLLLRPDHKNEKLDLCLHTITLRTRFNISCSVSCFPIQNYSFCFILFFFLVHVCTCMLSSSNKYCFN